MFICLSSFHKTVKRDIDEREYVLMWNLMPTDLDEAIALIPSLENTPKVTVERIIAFLNEKRGASR